MYAIELFVELIEREKIRRITIVSMDTKKITTVIRLDRDK